MKEIIAIILLFVSACASTPSGKCTELMATKPLNIALCEGRKCAIKLSTDMTKCSFALDVEVIADDAKVEAPTTVDVGAKVEVEVK